jgi:hypothetical protein
MSRMLAAAVVLAVLSPTSGIAGPPQKPAGAMTFDTVADGLRQYHKETDQAKRIRLLKKFAPTGDPRVAVALGEALSDPSEVVVAAAATAYCQEFTQLRGTARLFNPEARKEWALMWWRRSEPELRRDAVLLPR